MAFQLKNPRGERRAMRMAVAIVMSIATVSIAMLPASAAEAQRRRPQPPPVSTDQWRRMTPQEEAQTWNYILNSPLGIAALNQLAIEEFISPLCPKTFYTNDRYGGFQSLLRVKCPDERGVSIAQGYNEMRVIFGRFEDNIENFEIIRVYPDRQPTIDLGD